MCQPEGWFCMCCVSYDKILFIYNKLVTKRTYACRWWECVALPEDVDSSEEELFRQQIRDLAFTVIMQQIIHFIGHYETNSPRSTDGIIGHFNGASFSLMYQFNILYGQG